MSFGKYIYASKRFSLLYGWLFLLIPLFTGCIYQDEELCDDGGGGDDGTCIRFNFLYDYNMAHTDLFAEQVDHVTLIIYTEKGELEQVVEVYRKDMEENHTVSLVLSPGYHTAVAWGNIHTDHYRLSNHEMTSSHLLEMTCIEDETMTRANPGSLFHASNTFQIIAGDEYIVPMEMIKNSNQVKVVIKGLTEEDQQEAESRFVLRMSSNNWRYNYDNSINAEYPVTYLPERSPESDTTGDPDDISAAFTFYPLRLFTYDRETVLSLHYRNPITGREAALERPLVPYLLSRSGNNPDIMPAKDKENEYLDREDTYEVIFMLGVDVDGNIRIEEWDGINQGGNL